MKMCRLNVHVVKLKISYESLNIWPAICFNLEQSSVYKMYKGDQDTLFN